MTAKQLIKALEKLVAEHGNVPVCADCPALLDASNGVFEIANVTEAEVGMIAQCDGDGAVIQNKDGSERVRRCVVLR